MKKQDYVVGFLFRNNDSEVALIKKDRPQWQAGKLNGIGGKIEEGETADEAMDREFGEEAGLRLVPWQRFAVMEFRGVTDPSGGGGFIYFFRAAVGMEDSHLVRTQPGESEEVAWYPVGAFTRLPHIDNIAWLVPMALSGCTGTLRTF
jgi:8-oxo-dGTP pyrophosphatase MutT (NUDIX family)